MIRYLTGDMRETLATLEPGSIQSCITSPPYHGLRDYGIEPLVWGGDAEHGHEWGNQNVAPGWQAKNGTGATGLSGGVVKLTELRSATGNKNGGQFCQCGAWRGSLGLEPTPELFIEHMVECLHNVWRVLRNDGTLWLNLGDSYAGSGKGKPGKDGIQSSASQMDHVKYPGLSDGLHDGYHGVVDYQARPRWPKFAKPKDLLMIPFRVAMALQADGWWLRSVIPWVKRNSMPESVTDRPSTAVEYVFLLVKSARYYWDADAVRVLASNNTHSRGNGLGPKQANTVFGNGIKNNNDFGAAIHGYVSHRNRRNSDWFFESLSGLLLDEQDDPLALVVNPAPFSGAHFATFPPKLVEPMVKASTHPGDTILDPFGGAGTVGLVADRLGRNAILCELKPDYARMGAARITDDAPLFVELAGG